MVEGLEPLPVLLDGRLLVDEVELLRLARLPAQVGSIGHHAELSFKV